MGKVATYVQSFNTGVHDRTALPRTDLERMRLAAEIQTNLLPKAVGPASMRPGMEFLTTTAANAAARIKEFIFGVADAALMEFGTNAFRIILDDVPISRVTVGSTVTNGDFSSGAGWTTTGLRGGTSTITGGQLVMNAVNTDATALCSQGVATSSPGVEHALRIIVTRGPVTFRCGSSLGFDDYIETTVLPTGQHSLAFTPTGTFYVQFASTVNISRIVDSIQIETAGDMIIPTPWGAADLINMRLSQSADVCFVACIGFQQRRIERRGRRSWSVAIYQTDDGPLKAPADNTTRITPSFVNGNVTLTADATLFSASHVGTLFRLDHTGQFIQQTIAGEDIFTDPIRVTGVGSDRGFTYVLTGSWAGTVSLERSYDSATTGFIEVQTKTVNGSFNFIDTSDNSIYWYRLGFKVGNFSSGILTAQIRFDGGGGYGIARITDYVSPTLVGAEVLLPFKNTVFTRDWQEGEWSNKSGWPSAVTLSDGRLWWSGADKIWGSVSDAYASFNQETEGDSGPILRAIATGGVNNTQWLLSLQRLLVGTEGAVATVKSSSLDEPLTPTNFGIKDSSTVGAAPLDPIKVDARGLFIERAGAALIELAFDGGTSDYAATQISKLTTDLFAAGVKAVSVQRRPDTRIWIVLNDGTCVCMLYEPSDSVLAFVPVETDGLIESVAVLPSVVQDRVYFSVLRQVNGSPVRYIEKMALDTEVKPATLCKVMDAFASGTNSPASATVHVGSHLIGKTVVVWADGAPLETAYGVPGQYVVDGSGNIVLPAAVTNWVAGLPYRARYKSARLAYGVQGGTAMLQKKAVDALGMILTDFVRSGIKYGHSFDDPYRALFPMPQMADGKIQPNVVLSGIRDEEAFVFPGEWNTDSRICMEVNSPYTSTFLGLVMDITTNER